MPSRSIANLIFKVVCYQTQEFLGSTVSVVNLIGYALNVASVTDVKALCSVFDVCENIVDDCELCSNV